MALPYIQTQLKCERWFGKKCQTHEAHLVKPQCSLTAAVALLAKASCSKASFFMTTVLGRYLGCCWYVGSIAWDLHSQPLRLFASSFCLIRQSIICHGSLMRLDFLVLRFPSPSFFTGKMLDKSLQKINLNIYKIWNIKKAVNSSWRSLLHCFTNICFKSSKGWWYEYSRHHRHHHLKYDTRFR